MYFTIVFSFFCREKCGEVVDCLVGACQGLSPQEADVVGTSPLEAGRDIWFLGGMPLAVELLEPDRTLLSGCDLMVCSLEVWQIP